MKLTVLFISFCLITGVYVGEEPSAKKQTVYSIVKQIRSMSWYRTPAQL